MTKRSKTAKNKAFGPFGEPCNADYFSVGLSIKFSGREAQIMREAVALLESKGFGQFFPTPRRYVEFVLINGLKAIQNGKALEKPSPKTASA